MGSAPISYGEEVVECGCFLLRKSLVVINPYYTSGVSIHEYLYLTQRFLGLGTLVFMLSIYIYTYLYTSIWIPQYIIYFTLAPLQFEF